ncbi:MAG: uroporphyrinogen-III C-methyltransferase [Syntrophomonas sp.]|uniref:uroporphyrinogen-III C-methyltransferase n=1 Tax=Syntrophomonas sp. TaxID=2053627 RepID=UPI0026342478|nr:uroporphyrinogen-III C-methyltransferase [Syntrophomonas sp.]MDD2510422.1 uroporphyrinogen-III C-methyltransferase [Syntrophomonas sp.]MDD3878467.1 uroporphyrinogen-III C-methyltransferase [Syntrophomonas sp.]MDD4625883.1 uroporphyrinogen-III C-methyltransferase [Syntrophomonas sp.]
MEKKGLVYLIGAGPGDPGLFTLKGQRVLEKAEVVVYDRLVGDEILSMADPAAEFIYVGKASSRHALSQDEINALLAEKAAAGKIVARLKGGDPFLFGRGGEEALYLKERGYRFEVIPGITSAIAVPAYAGIPVTHRDATSSLAIITGHEKPGKKESSIHWRELANGIGTLVFLMGIENLGFICHNLITNGRDTNTPVALIRWGTLPQQQVLSGTLENIVERVKESGFQPPAVIVVGDVVKLREELNWLENQPLWGKRVVITRARAQASQLVERIRDLGGQAIEFPSIKIEKEKNLAALHNAFQNIGQYDWIIFTSINAVDIFFAESRQAGLDIRDLKGIKLGAIGPATRDKLLDRGLRVDIVPEDYRAEGILKELSARIKPGQWILLPRARGARSILPDTLRQWGAYVNEVYLYQAIAASQVSKATLKNIVAGNMDYLTFTSSSTVSNFVKIIGAENIPGLKGKVKVACIGPVTADTARENGFSVDILAQEYTISGLLEAILEDL